MQPTRALRGAHDCDRAVIREARNLEKHRGLRTHIEESVSRAKSLTACALTRFEVGHCRSPGLLSKRLTGRETYNCRPLVARTSRSRLTHLLAHRVVQYKALVTADAHVLGVAPQD
jgi:hypothetical protein